MSNEIEQALIGACLQKPEMIDLAAVIVKAEHFENKRLGNLYGLMIDIANSGVAPNIIEIAAQGKNGEVCGISIADIVGYQSTVIPMSYEVQRLSMLIKQSSIRRGASIMIKQLGSESETMSPEEIAISAGKIAEYAAENSDRTDETTAKKAAEQFFKELEQDDDNECIKSGIEPVDSITGGFFNSEVYVLAGRPSMGKSAMGLTVAKNLAGNGHPGVVFSLEMKTGSLMQRLVADISGVFLDKLRRKTIYDADWPKITYAMGVINQLPIHFIYNRAITTQEIHARLRIMKRKHGIRWALIDHLHLFRGKGTIFEIVSQTMLDVFSMAGDLDIPIIALAQLNRDGKERANKLPTLSDLRGSGEIEQSANSVFFVHGEDYHDVSISSRPVMAERVLIAAKQRQGDIGSIPFNFEGRIQRIHW